MLFKKHILHMIARGEVTRAFRVWRRPTVKVGGRLRTAVGELYIEDVREIVPELVSDCDGQAAGALGRDALLAEIMGRPGRLYRIDFRLERPDSRLALAVDMDLDAHELAAISATLKQFDRRSRTGSWTGEILALVARYPAKPAGELAELIGIDKSAFKRRMRDLKEIGLTESLETGYRLSPRGRRFLQARFGHIPEGPIL